LRILITTDNIEVEGELGNNSTADAIAAILPVEAPANRWGEEVYFDCPVAARADDMKQTMDVGDLGYWMEGGALAIFFGPTPASTDERPRAAVPVVFVGKVTGDASILGGIADGDIVRLEAIA
jgi:hypothetical protein